MTLKPSVRDFINSFEEKSGKPLVIQEDQTIPTLANLVVARGDAPFHLLRHRPTNLDFNYVVAFQIGLSLRQFELSPEDRWEIYSTDESIGEGIELMGLSEFPKEAAAELIQSLILQLRSCPIGILVDQLILREMAELSEEQINSVERQLDDNQQSLSPKVRKSFPKMVLDANLSMNAAYAKFWATELNEPRFFLPYEALGYTTVADTLLASISEGNSDQGIIDAWAKTLSLDGTFQFRQHT